MEEKNPIQVADRLFHTLELLSSRGEMGLIEISSELSLHKSTVHRLLNSLIFLGYARQREDGKYQATYKILDLANQLASNIDAVNVVRPYLRELARNGTKLTCIVDGVAMSGGSLIMCACDTVRVNPSSLVMIHKCWTFLWGGYNADELREQATQQEAWDKMQMEVYTRKTGLSATVISHMMADTTYMTGREAIDKGFADELIEDAEPTSIAASADGRSLFVNGRQMHLAPGMFAPDNIPTVTPEASAPVETDKNKPEVTGDEGGISMTKEELRAKYPDEIAQVEADARASVDHTEAVNTAIQAERARMQEIDEISGLLDATDVQQAKYGDKPCSAADLLMAAAKNAAKQGKKFLTDLKDDSEESGAEGVPAAPAPAVETPEGEDGEKNDTPEARMTNARSMVADLLGKKKEG